MIIIIDGYNVIKQALGAAHISHAQRNQFVAELVNYLRRKKLGGVIVFDGGEYSYPHSTRQGDIEIIFSGYKEKADAVIMRYVDEHLSNELLIVSSDREIRQYAHARNKQTIGAPEFYAQYVRKKEMAASAQLRTEICKTSQDAPVELDELMRESTRNIQSKDADVQVGLVQRRNSSAHKPSKKERKQHRLLRKL